MGLDREAWRFVLPLVPVTLLAFWWHLLVGCIVLGALLFTLWFFRDPTRNSSMASSGWLAPVDGRILASDPGRVSIFMNVFNVHVCRTPVAGTVIHVQHHAGRFRAAWRDDAPEANERTEITVEGEHGHCRFVLVAGLVARRIVCRVKVGDQLERGQRVGIIRFGSRVDVELPRDLRCPLDPGQHTVGGQTLIGRKSEEIDG